MPNYSPENGWELVGKGVGKGSGAGVGEYEGTFKGAISGTNINGYVACPALLSLSVPPIFFPNRPKKDQLTQNPLSEKHHPVRLLVLQKTND
jgi:hypothetical protein